MVRLPFVLTRRCSQCTKVEVSRRWGDCLDRLSQGGTAKWALSLEVESLAPVDFQEQPALVDAVVDDQEQCAAGNVVDYWSSADTTDHECPVDYPDQRLSVDPAVHSFVQSRRPHECGRTSASVCGQLRWLPNHIPRPRQIELQTRAIAARLPFFFIDSLLLNFLGPVHDDSFNTLKFKPDDLRECNCLMRCNCLIVFKCPV